MHIALKCQLRIICKSHEFRMCFDVISILKIYHEFSTPPSQSRGSLNVVWLSLGITSKSSITWEYMRYLYVWTEWHIWNEFQDLRLFAGICVQNSNWSIFFERWMVQDSIFSHRIYGLILLIDTLKATCQTTTNEAGTSITFSGFDQMLNLGQMGETLVLEVKRYTQINWNHSKFSQKVLWLAPTEGSHCLLIALTHAHHEATCPL